MGKRIEHLGFIERITDKYAVVKILSESACAACHAKGSCSASEMQDKEIEVAGNFSGFSIGDMVNVYMEQSQGFRALLIGYVYPFILLFLALIIASSAGMSELKSGLLSLTLVPVYYLFIFLFKDKIRRNFTFSISKSE
ncbi:MAG: SoxR reducing system RseC family protein [Bacteroidales bacterium]|nr:SoxR reducing system RseC family protein [Bacteroidales bacterium]